MEIASSLRVIIAGNLLWRMFDYRHDAESEATKAATESAMSLSREAVNDRTRERAAKA